VGFLGQGEVARGKRFAHISQSKNEWVQLWDLVLKPKKLRVDPKP
jgi:hypothetical protein